jgi:hypothetical protein
MDTQYAMYGWNGAFGLADMHDEASVPRGIAMAVAFYSQDDTLIDPEHYLAYIELAPESLCYLDSFDLAEGRLLGRWVEACQQHKQTVGHFSDDTLLRCVELPTAIDLLEHWYHHLTGRTLFRDDPEAPHIPIARCTLYCIALIRKGAGLLGCAIDDDAADAPSEHEEVKYNAMKKVISYATFGGQRESF